jgi:uncharacterized protein YabE (DUF348 family)
MNIPSKLDKLHSFYGKAKYAFLTIFALTVVFTTFVSHNAYGDSVVGTVQTKLTLNIDGKTRNIDTTQNTIGGALVQNGIAMAGNDITEPPLDTYLSGKTIDVQVVRALPVLISDNGQSWPGFSVYTQPIDIMKQLNVEIFPEDKVSAELILDPAVEGAVGQKVIIQRAPVYTIYVDDTTKVVRSWANTIGGVLSGAVVLGQRDIVEPAVDQKAIAGEIVVTRINVFEATETNTIKYITVYRDNYYLAEGVKNTVTAGSNGSVSQTFRITMRNGNEVDRILLSESVLQNAVTAVVERGLMPSGRRNFRRDYWDIMVAAGTKYGMNPLSLFTVASCESNLHADSVNYSGPYYGLYQYNSGLWSAASSAAGYPGYGWENAEAQIYATAKYAAKYGWKAWSNCAP